MIHGIDEKKCRLQCWLPVAAANTFTKNTPGSNGANKSIMKIQVVDFVSARSRPNSIAC